MKVCTWREGRRCNCRPTYQASSWSAKDDKQLRKTFPTLAGARAPSSRARVDGSLVPGSTQQYYCVMTILPPFADSGNPPEGVHDAPWDEIVARFGTTERRRELLDGFRRALRGLRAAGCRRAYLDGSFVTAKPEPGDFGACWEMSGVDPDLLGSTLLMFADGRAAQKALFGGELFPAEWGADPYGTRFHDYFQHDTMTGKRKGIVAVDLEGLR